MWHIGASASVCWSTGTSSVMPGPSVETYHPTDCSHGDTSHYPQSPIRRYHSFTLYWRGKQGEMTICLGYTQEKGQW